MNKIIFLVSLTTFFLGALYGLLSKQLFKPKKKLLKEDPDFKKIEMNIALRKRIHELIDTKEKREALFIQEQVHIMPYFLLPPSGSTVTQIIDANETCPLICLVGAQSQRLYLLPLLIMFPDLRQS